MPKFPAVFILHFKLSQTMSCNISVRKKSFTAFVGLNNTFEKSPLSWKSIISDYIRSGRLDDARHVFEKIPSPDVYLYTIMIGGYSRNNRITEALDLFYEMPMRDVVSWNSMIKGCLDCGELELARKVFDRMPERNVISWTTMVNGFAQLGRIELAEELFHKMPSKDTAAWNSIIFGYCRNGRIEDACILFEKMTCRNVISWTTMISGFDQHGDSEKALVLFQQMWISGVKPTSSTFASAITACANIPSLTRGTQLHGHLIKSGNVVDTFVSTSLITLYATCKIIENSHKVFEETMNRNVVVWTALLTGYGSNGKHEDALEVFCNMIKAGINPNQSTFTSALNSCCGLEALDRGKVVHTRTIKAGLDLGIFVANSLIVMYTKCGNISDGVTAFDTMSKRNLVTWNAIILGCAQHGFGQLALEYYDCMVNAAVQPDEITFVGLLTACSHCRMLDKGRHFFKLLNQDLSIEMKLEHYSCMVDVLGRSGNLEEAEELIKSMPMPANSIVWLALLSACTVHSNLEVGRRAAARLLDLEPHSSAAYILLSNIYASSGRWNDVSRIRKTMKQQGITKTPGCSWITLKGLKHEFLCGDRSHPMSKQIYEKLDWLGTKLKELGYVPNKSFVLHDVEDEQKEAMLAYHSERLAIGFGLVSSAEGIPITVIKNLRICGDCHYAIKLISKIVCREIVVRDWNRFHHFKNGTCSCGEYW